MQGVEASLSGLMKLDWWGGCVSFRMGGLEGGCITGKVKELRLWARFHYLYALDEFMMVIEV